MPKPVHTKVQRLDALYQSQGHFTIASLSDGPPAQWRGSPDGPLAIVVSLYEQDSEEMRFLGGIFKDLHITPQHIFLTTCTKHFTTKEHELGNYHDSNRTVTRKEIEGLRPFLLQELAIVDARAILCIGSNSLRILTGERNATVKEYRDKENWIDAIDAPVFATVSPHYVLLTGKRSPAYRAVINDFNRAIDRAWSQ